MKHALPSSAPGIEAAGALFTGAAVSLRVGRIRIAPSAIAPIAPATAEGSHQLCESAVSAKLFMEVLLVGDEAGCLVSPAGLAGGGARTAPERCRSGINSVPAVLTAGEPGSMVSRWVSPFSAR